jgi:5-(carboxyamino)imidazole ribonucleotide synthase
MSRTIRLGVIGGGQLGSLLCSAAKKLKVKTVVLSDDKEGPAQHFCDEFIYSKYDDNTKVKEFISKVDFVTYEFENIPVDFLNLIQKEKKVLPSPKINKIAQNRKLEKTFVNELGISTTDWVYIKSAEDIKKNQHLLPGILKSNTLGYDGKGQFVLNSLDDVKQDWCFTNDYILEKKVNLKKEISVVVARYADGTMTNYEPIENVHQNQILHKSKIPADISDKIFKSAINNAKKIAEKFSYVGILTIEYFVTNKDELLVNELAPRFHNSGHLTIEAFNISQFENHVRAVCSLKSKPIEKISNAEMYNILGSEIHNYKKKTFKKNEFFHDYLKKEPREGRKMGHLTILKD